MLNKTEAGHKDTLEIESRATEVDLSLNDAPEYK